MTQQYDVVVLLEALESASSFLFSEFGAGALYGVMNYGNDAPDVHRSDDGAVTWSVGFELKSSGSVVSMTAVN